ncbi:MAG: hypothetical protein M3Y69_08810, partial [Verrucomicrobiota bacterium]|nr:hypothetical protein [Verrucomicrobiota bacterium]
MRAVFAALVTASALVLASCANDGPTGEEVQAQLQRGATGQGRLTPDVDRSDDPYVKPREGRP